MFSIYKKELRLFFSTPTGYVVIVVFLLLTGLFLWVIPGRYNILESGYANLDGLFYLSPWLFLLLCPAITMRSFAEEQQSGTWEWLQTKPISHILIITGKYLANLTVVLLALLPTILYFFTVYYLAEPMGNVDSGQFWGSFIGLILLGIVYISLGMFAASLTKNQITAFILAVIISFVMYYGFDLISSFFLSGKSKQIIANIGINAHYKSISRGVLYSTDLNYYLILTAISLFGTQFVVSRQK